MKIISKILGIILDPLSNLSGRFSSSKIATFFNKYSIAVFFLALAITALIVYLNYYL